MTFRIYALALSVLLSLGATTAQARGMSPAEASQRIAEAVKAAKPIAESGVHAYKIKRGTKTVREAMLALAIEVQSDDEESFDSSWVGDSDEAWSADSSAWGEATMKDAYQYMFSVDRDHFSNLTAAEQAKLKQNIARGKKAFGQFVGTGVMFGVAPIGAVQCGVTFAALVIVDPHSGKAYVFAKEPSGC